MRLAGLDERLRRARRRSVYATLANFVVASVLISLGVFCLLQLAHNLLGTLAPSVTFAAQLVPDWMSNWRPPPFSQNVLLATGAGLVAIAVMPVIAVMQHPSIAFMARAADRRFATDECLSTALEVSSAPARWPGVVAQALLNYANIRSVEVEPRHLVPMRLPRFAAGIPILLGFAAMITIVPPPPLVQDAYYALLPEASETLLPEIAAQAREQQQRTAANLRAIAAILKQDGEARADPAIQAISNALDRLGKEVGANAGMRGETLSQELGRLLGLARDAYARAGEEEASRNLARLIAGLNELAPNRPEGAYQNVPIKPATGQAREDTPIPDNPLAGLLTTREYAGIDDFADMVPPGTVLGDPRRDQQRGGDGPPDAVAMDERTVANNPVDADYGPDGPDADGVAAGVMIGGADGVGPGDYAGVGARDLFGRVTRPGDPIDVDGEMVLENPGIGGGRRIRLNLPPQIELQIPAATVPGAVGGWRTLAEEQVTRTDLPAPARDVVSRYFEALRLRSGN